MQEFKLIFALATIAWLAPSLPAHAGPAPRQMYGKSIRIEYTVASTHSDDHRAHVSDVRRTIYVSSTGRLFERAQWTAGRRGGISDNAPEASQNRGHEARGMSFRGNTLIATIGYASGAGQMTVTFDPSFSNCTGQVRFGRNGGQTMARRGLDGRIHRITSIAASSFSCSVVAGNAF